MSFLTFIVVAGLIGIIVFAVSRSRTENEGSWIQFFAKGKDLGFSFKELELLRRLAVKGNLEDPTALFWSHTQLDLCIRTLVRSMRMSGEEEDPGNQDFLSKLYDFRKKIVMDTPKIKWGISNSRQISEGQALRILVAGTGVFKSQIVKNTAQYITISRPVNAKVSPSFAWRGVKVSVYFWRQDDAGYVFDSEVIDEVFSKNISSLKIAHSDSLFRTQKRKSIRVKLHKPAFLYLMGPEEEPGRMESAPGVKCFLEDLSDTGCAIIIGGKASPGLRIKVQFAVNNSPVCMSGTVRSVDFKEDTNRSVLHIEADTLPIKIRNRILGEVFGMMSDDDEELPFRVIEDTNTPKAGAGPPPQTAETVTAAPDALVSGSEAPAAPDTAAGEPGPAVSGSDVPPAPPAKPSLLMPEQDEPALVPFDGDAL
ncbi:MAG: PilZ domain-containing protein [Treponema sp.]|jgi:c-di-GMP-binding flagellar brake protein YcgR|nr:PilZ domain-containing protein [Treponema sp.]